MFNDLAPILKAASVVPVYLRNADEDTPPPTTVRDFASEMLVGCFNCRHGSTMSTNRRYATTVFYGLDSETDSYSVPVIGVVWSPQDTANQNGASENLLHQLKRNLPMFGTSRPQSDSWWFLDENIQREYSADPYIRKYYVFRNGDEGHINSRWGGLTDELRLALSNTEAPEMYSITAYFAPGIYMEPSARELMDFNRMPMRNEPSNDLDVDDVIGYLRLGSRGPWSTQSGMTILTQGLHGMFPNMNFDEYNGVADRAGRSSRSRGDRFGMTRLRVDSVEPTPGELNMSSEQTQGRIRLEEAEADRRASRIMDSLNSVRTTTNAVNTQASIYRDLVRNLEDRTRRSSDIFGITDQ